MAFKFCPECGFKLDREYKFCPECGYKLASIENASTNIINDSFLSASVSDAAADSDIDFGGLENAFDTQIKEKQEDESEDYESELKKALVYCIRNKPQQAKAIYQRLIDKNPEDITAHIGMLRAVSKNLTEYNTEDAEEQLVFLKRFFSEEQLLAEEPKIAEFYKIKEKYLKDKEDARILAEKTAKFERARQKFESLLALDNSNRKVCVGFGVYPQSLKKEDVQIVYDERDEKYGYYVGSDGNFYEKFNDKYFMLERIYWYCSLNSCPTSLFSTRIILDYSPFGVYSNYEESELRKLMQKFAKTAFLDTYAVAYQKYNCQAIANIDSPSGLKNNFKTYITFKNAQTALNDYAIPPRADEAVFLQNAYSSKPWFTDYALERYRVLKGDSTIEKPTSSYWTRNSSRYSGVCYGDINMVEYQYHQAMQKRQVFPQCVPASVLGVRPTVKLTGPKSTLYF